MHRSRKTNQPLASKLSPQTKEFIRKGEQYLASELLKLLPAKNSEALSADLHKQVQVEALKRRAMEHRKRNAGKQPLTIKEARDTLIPPDTPREKS